MPVFIIYVCLATWSYIWDIKLKQSGVFRKECVCVQSKLKREGSVAINIPLYTKEECLTHHHVSPVGYIGSLSLVLLFEYPSSKELCPLLVVLIICFFFWRHPSFLDTDFSYIFGNYALVKHLQVFAAPGP